jgi:CRISPR-associated protein Csd1
VDAYTLGLNYLRRGEQTRHIDRTADIAYVFWSRQPTDFDLNATVFVAEPEHVKRLYEAPYRPSGQQALSEKEADEFYVMVLSAGRGRAVVRDWIESHLPIARANLKQWFDDLTIIADRHWPGKENPRVSRGQQFKEFPLGALVRSLGVKKEKGYEVPAGLANDLFRSAIRGDKPPRSVLAAALGRIRATHDMPPPQAALLRLTLNRYARLQSERGCQMSDRVNESQPDAAYVCGRLFAMLERVQFLALGSVNASILDRYFGAASTAPWTVFPHLLRNAQHHLSRLRTEKPGAVVNVEKDLEAHSHELNRR